MILISSLIFAFNDNSIRASVHGKCVIGLMITLNILFIFEFIDYFFYVTYDVNAPEIWYLFEIIEVIAYIYTVGWIWILVFEVWYSVR